MNAERWPWHTALLVLILIELLYIVATRLLLNYFEDPHGINLELIRSGVRLASAGLTWWVFKDILHSATSRSSKTIHIFSRKTLLLLIATMILFSVPIMVGNFNLPPGETRLVFAITSFPVGLREELVYRGVLLTLLIKRFGFIGGLLISTLAFTFYHYGALPWTFFNVSQYIAAGLLLGTLFVATRSLWLVVWLHTLYDAIYCYTPFFMMPFSSKVGIMAFSVSISLIAIWVFKAYQRDHKLLK